MVVYSSEPSEFHSPALFFPTSVLLCGHGWSGVSRSGQCSTPKYLNIGVSMVSLQYHCVVLRVGAPAAHWSEKTRSPGTSLVKSRNMVVSNSVECASRPLIGHKESAPWFTGCSMTTPPPRA